MNFGFVKRALASALNSPFYTFSFFLGQVAPGYFRKRYARLAKRQGIKQGYFILSFDCDTEKDIEVVEGVHARLNKIGIMPSYAVPGELLKSGREVYRRIKDTGAEFINHGYRSHTSYIASTRSYVSTLFYDKMTPEEVREDVFRGHEACVEVLGENPRGFRTPHFGTYQKAGQLKYLYGLLAELGYRFSSSTTPVTGMWHGPVYKGTESILEFPVSGCFDYPARILDSWGFRFSPTRGFSERDYVAQFEKMACFLSDAEHPGVLNIYADPSQVYDWPAFFECMEKTRGLMDMSFGQLADEVNR
jgi:hypothetical protein